jgi:hypothetical protein
MWFLPLRSPDRAPWVFHLVWKLLHNDRPVVGLLARNPFPDEPPRLVRAELYVYRFNRARTPVWERQRLRSWLPPMSAHDAALRDILHEFDWPI